MSQRRFFWYCRRCTFIASSSRQALPGSAFYCRCSNPLPPRTAGFNTADLAAMGSTSQALMVVLMLLGGSPGSTAGGMKKPQHLLFCWPICGATFRRREDAEFFGRRIDSSAVKNAATIAGMYLTLFFLGAFVIATAEQLPMSVCLYETASGRGNGRSDIGYHAAVGHPFAGGADRTDVFGTCWWIDVDLCGIWQQPCPLSSAAGEDRNRIKETSMKSILLIGLGRFGRHIAQELNEVIRSWQSTATKTV